MTYNNFLSLTEWTSKQWGCTSRKGIERIAKDYFAEFKRSNENGEPTRIMKILCKNLIEEVEETKSDYAKDFLEKITEGSNWIAVPYQCEYCDKREIAFFSKTDIENIERFKRGEMEILEALPNHSSMVVATFSVKKCLCMNCWQKYWRCE